MIEEAEEEQTAVPLMRKGKIKDYPIGYRDHPESDNKGRYYVDGS